MRENVKNVGLILALIIAGVSLPTSIMSLTNKPTTPITEINNYYYNTTIVEQYNTELIAYPSVRNDFSFNSTYLNETVSYIYNATSNYRLFVHVNKTKDWEPEIDILINFYDMNLDFIYPIQDLNINGLGQYRETWQNFPYSTTWLLEFVIVDQQPVYDTNMSLWHQVREVF